MPLARKYQIPPDESGYYHCISRCVRRAFLCGFDRYSGCSFEHRRSWIVDRLTFLTTLFAIDIYAYSIMHNHYHLVLFVDNERGKEWDDWEVVQRWTTLFSGATHSPSEDQLTTWRKRLSSVSWFMRCVNEPIARRANFEDNCKGHFWEKRFKSIALLDEAAIFACMAYVDLNPYRAGIADGLVDADYTSIQQRLKKSHQPKIQHPPRAQLLQEKRITPILGLDKERLSISAKSYAELVEWTINPTEEGSAIATLESLNINQNQWAPTVQRFRKSFGFVAGNLMAIDEFIQRTKRKRRPTKNQHSLYRKPSKPPT